MKKKWIFKQSAAHTLAGAANGRRPLAARGLSGMNASKIFACFLLNVLKLGAIELDSFMGHFVVWT